MSHLEVGGKFKPHPGMKKVYYIYLTIASTPLLILTASLIYVAHTLIELPHIALPASLIPLTTVIIAAGVTAYWIPKYYDSISVELRDSEIVLERGVWWKVKHIIPYPSIVSVEVTQGPISSKFRLWSLHIYTGTTSGTRMTNARETIQGITNYLELKDTIMTNLRKTSPTEHHEPTNIRSEILEELKKIRKTLRKTSKHVK
ncbi:MAG: PH domain-containing protein [Sulfolobales archaeon]|nr:PH domain-containing protein [Sulfolobales archaeon]